MQDFFDMVSEAVSLLRKEYEAALDLCRIYATTTNLHDLVAKDAELLREFDELRIALLNDTINDDEVQPKYDSLVDRVDVLHQDMRKLITTLVLNQLNGDFKQ